MHKIACVHGGMVDERAFQKGQQFFTVDPLSKSVYKTHTVSGAYKKSMTFHDDFNFSLRWPMGAGREWNEWKIRKMRNSKDEKDQFHSSLAGDKEKMKGHNLHALLASFSSHSQKQTPRLCHA